MSVSLSNQSNHDQVGKEAYCLNNIAVTMMERGEYHHAVLTFRDTFRYVEVCTQQASAATPTPGLDYSSNNEEEQDKVHHDLYEDSHLGQYIMRMASSRLSDTYARWNNSSQASVQVIESNDFGALYRWSTEEAGSIAVIDSSPCPPLVAVVIREGCQPEDMKTGIVHLNFGVAALLTATKKSTLPVAHRIKMLAVAQTCFHMAHARFVDLADHHYHANGPCMEYMILRVLQMVCLFSYRQILQCNHNENQSELQHKLTQVEEAIRSTQPFNSEGTNVLQMLCDSRTTAGAA